MKKRIWGAALTLVTAISTASAEPVDIQVAYSSGKLAKQIDCQWRLMNEEGKEKGEWHGSAFTRDLQPDRYIFYLDCKHYQGALSFTVAPGKTYIGIVTVREY